MTVSSRLGTWAKRISIGKSSMTGDPMGASSYTGGEGVKKGSKGWRNARAVERRARAIWESVKKRTD